MGNLEHNSNLTISHGKEKSFFLTFDFLFVMNRYGKVIFRSEL